MMTLQLITFWSHLSSLSGCSLLGSVLFFEHAKVILMLGPLYLQSVRCGMFFLHVYVWLFPYDIPFLSIGLPHFNRSLPLWEAFLDHHMVTVYQFTLPFACTHTYHVCVCGLILKYMCLFYCLFFSKFYDCRHFVVFISATTT